MRKTVIFTDRSDLRRNDVSDHQVVVISVDDQVAEVLAQNNAHVKRVSDYFPRSFDTYDSLYKFYKPQIIDPRRDTEQEDLRTDSLRAAVAGGLLYYLAPLFYVRDIIERVIETERPSHLICDFTDQRLRAVFEHAAEEVCEKGTVRLL